MQVRPIDALLTRVRADVLADGVVTDDEVASLTHLARDSSGGTSLATPSLKPLVSDHAAAFSSSAALARARALLDVDGGPVRRPDTDTVRYVAPPDNQTVRSHALYIKKDGVLTGDTGKPSYSRGWGQFNAGVLEQAHGSGVPSSSLHDLATRATLGAMSPAQRLDAALGAFGRARLLATGPARLGRRLLRVVVGGAGHAPVDARRRRGARGWPWPVDRRPAVPVAGRPRQLVDGAARRPQPGRRRRHVVRARG
jgi:hypothetical protein